MLSNKIQKNSQIPLLIEYLLRYVKLGAFI